MGNNISLIVCKVLFSLVPRPAILDLGTRLGTVVLKVKAELTVLQTHAGIRFSCLSEPSLYRTGILESPKPH